MRKKRHKKVNKEIIKIIQVFAIYTKCYKGNKGLRQIMTRLSKNAQESHTVRHIQKRKQYEGNAMGGGVADSHPLGHLPKKMEMHPRYEK